MLQNLLAFACQLGFSTFQGVFFLDTCPPCGIFEALTTPLTAASFSSNLEVMAKDFNVCCVLRDMASREWISTTQSI